MVQRSPTSAEQDFIAQAAKFLEHPNLVIRMANLIGQPIDILQKSLPKPVKLQINQAVEKSLKQALRLAVASLKTPSDNYKPEWEEAFERCNRSFWVHTAASAGSGAIGGWMGLAALPLELPLSTTLILRSISSVAADWGHNIRDPHIQMECLFVFQLGTGHSPDNEEMNEAYLTSRIASAKLLRDAAIFLSNHSSRQVLAALEHNTAPIVVALLNKIARSFELAVSRKVLTMSVPVVGAISGAAINAAFCDYFTMAARYHFGIRHLEERYEKDLIHRLYQEAWQRSPEPFAHPA